MSLTEWRAQIDAYDFRSLHPRVRFGTASDRYAGWIGQVYPERYAPKVKSRTRRLGGETYEERTLPVASVADYFEHFGVLELDFTFYRPLLDADGEPSNTLFFLQQYAEHAPDDARFLLKTPQTYFARTLRRSRGGEVRYVDNEDFLNADAYVQQFHEPARRVLGERLVGFIFQQEYQRVRESPSPEENVAELDGFFSAIPGDVQAHLELRSEHLLAPPYFGWLEDRGLGFVFSHWTWLPPIRDQWRRGGERFTAANGEVVARLLTPRDVKYAKAYAAAYPFDQTVPEIAETQQARDMVLDATALIFQAQKQQATLNLIANNRAWGNAPALAQAIAHRMVDEVEKRQGGQG
jgi:uncharacterized protein YecE (DUF72 family)